MNQNQQRTGARAYHSTMKAKAVRLQAAAAIACLMAGTVPGWAQDPATAGLPPEPTPNYTKPVDLRPTAHDYTRERWLFPNIIGPYAPASAPPPIVTNSPRLQDLVKDGKIYLSLTDAIILALENNYDIAIQRYNLNIADTDILRAKAGSPLLGSPAGLVTNTIGGTSSALSSGGGPGGTSAGAGGAGTGAGGLSLSTNGGGPQPENLDPVLTGTVQLERSRQQGTTVFAGGSQNTNIYNFAYNQGFISGTQLQVGFNNQYQTSNNQFNVYSPALTSSFRATLTQHLLQGFGPGVNGRFILQAKNDRKITNSAFRQQILYTINQVENIYWSLVSDYEDVQAKQRSLDQARTLASDNRKQLQIGTLAPLDVVQSDATVASDEQALISSQTTLQFEQLVIKQAISRNLNDPALTNAAVIPTDRVSLLETPEEKMSVDELSQQAYANRPEIEQAILTLKNDAITLKGVKNGLLPTLDAFAFYGASGIGGKQSQYLNCNPDFTSPDFIPCPPGTVPNVGYGTVFSDLFKSNNPDKGVGFTLNIPLRNRTAQAEQERSVLEYRQAQLRLQQLYVQIRMQVIQQQLAITNDRAQLQAALAAQEYARQSLDAEQKKYRLGASTTYNVLLQASNLATADNNVIVAQNTYAVARAAFAQILANTLEKYNISLENAATGNITQQLAIPGLEPAKQLPEVQVPGQQERLQQQEQPAPQPPPVLPPSTPQ